MLSYEDWLARLPLLIAVAAFVLAVDGVVVSRVLRARRGAKGRRE